MDDLPDWAAKLEASAELKQGQARGICDLCVLALGVSGGGISVVTATGNRGMICATDELSAVIEDLQFVMGEGPCLQASQTNAPVLIDNVADERDRLGAEWATFMSTLAARGVGGLFAFPLRIGTVNIGALDLYREAPGPLSRTQLAGALMAADAAAGALLNLEISEDGSLAEVDGNNYNMEVHQATGMVRVQLHVSSDDALLMMRARAFASGQRLAQIARDVVERRLRFDREDDR